MPIVVIAFYSLLLLAIGMFVTALLRRPQLALPAAVLSYLLAFVSGFSIGLIVLVVTFMSLAIALVTWFGRRDQWHRLLAAIGGAGAWAVAVRTVDDAWLFLPLRLGTVFF